MNEVEQYFTVEEANARLPLVTRVVRDIVSLYGDVHERRRRLEEIRLRRGDSDEAGSLYREEVSEVEKDLRRDIEQLDGFVGELKSLNVLLKDPIIGRVDFPTKIDDQDACLCWQQGEAEILHWHPMESGCSERTALYEGSIAGFDAEDSNGE